MAAHIYIYSKWKSHTINRPLPWSFPYVFYWWLDFLPSIGIPLTEYAHTLKDAKGYIFERKEKEENKWRKEGRSRTEQEWRACGILSTSLPLLWRTSFLLFFSPQIDTIRLPLYLCIWPFSSTFVRTSFTHSSRVLLSVKVKLVVCLPER